MRMGMRTGTSPHVRSPFVRSPFDISRARRRSRRRRRRRRRLRARALLPSLPSFPPSLPSSFSPSGFPPSRTIPARATGSPSACSKSASEAATSARRWLLDATRDENLPAPLGPRAASPRRPKNFARSPRPSRSTAPRASPPHHALRGEMAAVAIDPRATTRSPTPRRLAERARRRRVRRRRRARGTASPPPPPRTRSVAR